MRLVQLLFCWVMLSVASARGEGVWFLHLSKQAEEKFVLKNARFAPAEQRKEIGGTHRYEIFSPEGTVVRSGAVDLENWSRLEGADPQGRISRFQRDGGDVHVRVPALENGHRLRLTRKTGRQSSMAVDEIVADFELPQRRQTAAIQSGQGDFEVIFESGSRDNRINMVVFGDGFQDWEEADFRIHAASAVGKFLQASPMAKYHDFFNAYSVFTPSIESGSDHPNAGIRKDTFFNSTYDSWGIYYLVTIPPNDRDSRYEAGYGKVYDLLAEHVPEYDIILMIVNDAAYGGSGGVVAVASINENAGEIMVHELGHTFAGLGDEYTTPYPGFPDTEEPNTTRETRRDFIKWRAWIDSTTSIPTPATAGNINKVGLFQGAHYHSTGWYRPKLNCKMRELGSDFCQVCAEALTLGMYKRVNMIDHVTPDVPIVTIGPEGEVFQVILLTGEDVETEVVWTVDGLLQPEQDGTFRVSAGQLSPGTHNLAVTVGDRTSLVRSDPSSEMIDAYSWTIIVPTSLELRMLNPESTGERFQFEVNRPVALGVVEWSNNLKDWSPVLTNAFITGVKIEVPQDIGSAAGYYRIQEK